AEPAAPLPEALADGYAVPVPTVPLRPGANVCRRCLGHNLQKLRFECPRTRDQMIRDAVGGSQLEPVATPDNLDVVPVKITQKRDNLVWRRVHSSTSDSVAVPAASCCLPGRPSFASFVSSLRCSNDGCDGCF